MYKGDIMKLDSKSILGYEEHILRDKKYYLCQYDRLIFDDDEWDEFLDYDEDYRLQVAFGDSVPSKEIRKNWFAGMSEEYEPKRCLLLDESLQIIGRLSQVYYTEKSPTYNDNKNTCEIFIDIKSTHQKMGLGSFLLKHAVNIAHKDHKTKYQSNYMLEKSGRFCEKYGFSIASARHLNRLYMKDVDWSLMDSWASSGNVEVHEIIPEEDLIDYCQMYTECGMMAPDYDGDYTASEQLTPESKRRMEADCKKDGICQLTGIVKNDEGKIIGMTEVAYYLADPTKVYQELTGVLTDYRGKGIGKLLKSAMLIEVKNKVKEIEYMETGNNDKNYAMLAINTKMGFKEHAAHFLVTGDIKRIYDLLN